MSAHPEDRAEMDRLLNGELEDALRHRRKKTTRQLLKDAADMVRREADEFQSATGDESGVADGFYAVAERIERLR